MKHPFSLPQEIAQEPIETIFSREFLIANKGLYVEEPNNLPFDQEGNITLWKLFEILPIKDFCCFLIHAILNSKQAQWFALNCAEFALPRFEEVYPDDDSLRNCIKMNEKALLGEISTYSVVYCAAHFAAAASSRAAADVADVADVAYYAAAAAADVSAAADATTCDSAASAYTHAAVDAAYNAYLAADAAANAAQDSFKPFVKNWLNQLLNHQNN
jgi:hypothetical protein